MDTLHVAATRPALLWGLPYALALALLVLAAEIQVGVHGLRGVVWAAALVGPLWVGARYLVAYDYHAMGVALLWLNTSARDFGAKEWGGSSVAPLSHKRITRYRGMARV